MTPSHPGSKVSPYFGDPAAATREEGEATIAVLGEILEEAVLGAMASP